MYATILLLFFYLTCVTYHIEELIPINEQDYKSKSIKMDMMDTVYGIDLIELYHTSAIVESLERPSQ